MEERGLIGIVSGLGPLAGSDVLDRALAYAAEGYGAVEDADYPDIVLFSHGIESFDATGSMEADFLTELVRVVQQIELHHPTVLVMAHELDAAGDRIDEFVRRLETPFDGIIAACTELPIALDHSPIPYEIPVVSSNQVLAHALVDTYCTRLGDGHVRASRYQRSEHTPRGEPCSIDR